MHRNQTHAVPAGWYRITATLAVLLTSLAQTGCRTASSLGLPLSSGMNYLLSDAAEIRREMGHRSDVSTELAKATLKPHQVEAGDVLVIEPNDFNSPIQIPSDHTVQQDGTIDLGGYGRIQVSGLTVSDIQQRVQQTIIQTEMTKPHRQIGLASHNNTPGSESPEPDLSVAVRLISQERGLVYVMGEVNAPGSYPLTGSETALDAIIAAGGLSDRANEHKVILTRPRIADQPRLILPICYQRVLQLGDVSTNYQLQPGDRIYVPSLTIWEDFKSSTGVNRGKSCPQCRDFSPE